MSYLISEAAQDLLGDVKDFCENEVKEPCKEFDRSGEWPKEIYDKAIEMQLQTLEVPEEYGGPGLSRVYVGAHEIPRVQNGLGICILSTSHAVLAGDKAHQMKVGGELLCEIW